MATTFRGPRGPGYSFTGVVGPAFSFFHGLLAQEGDNPRKMSDKAQGDEAWAVPRCLADLGESPNSGRSLPRMNVPSPTFVPGYRSIWERAISPPKAVRNNGIVQGLPAVKDGPLGSNGFLDKANTEVRAAARAGT